MNKRLYAASTLAVCIGVVAVTVRNRSIQTVPDRATEPVLGTEERQQIRKTVESMRRALPALLLIDEQSDRNDAPPPHYDVNARAERIEKLAAFHAFADGAQLDGYQRYTVAHILALHYENDAALVTTTTDLDLLSSMRRQLLGDTMAQLQARIPGASWEAFVKSGLIVGEVPEGKDPT